MAPDQIVEIDGKVGVFTPLVGTDPKDTGSTDNLQQVVDVLRGHVARLQTENTALTAKLAELSAPPRSTDDFAAGLQHSLDVLQGRLNAMDNAATNFAVREFQLESKVLVDVGDGGAIGFRFVAPGDQVDAATLSTLNVTVVPIPKPPPPIEEPAPVPAPAPGPAPAPAPSPVGPANPGVETIDGLTDAQVAALRAKQIDTVSDFRRVATEATASATLVSLLGVDRDALGRFTLLAALLTVPGIGERDAAILYDAGITDLASLARARPAALSKAYDAAASKRPDDDGTRPSKDDAAAWVEAAKKIVQAG